MSEQKQESRTWVICGHCEEGLSYHDCGEDSCCCLNPMPNVVCDTCDGKGGWYVDEWFGDSIYQDELDQIFIAREAKQSKATPPNEGKKA